MKLKMSEWASGTGVFIPCLDPEPLIKHLKQQAFEASIRRRRPIMFAVGIHGGKYGLLVYRKPLR